MKTKVSDWQRGLLLSALGLVGLLMSGCATPALWKHTAARTWRPEAVPEHFLTITVTGRQDVIVVFRQSAMVAKKARERLVAWRPGDCQTDLVIGRRAVRQLTNSCDHVQIMPAFHREMLPGDMSTTAPGYVVLEQPYRFSIHLEGAPSGPFQLPISNVKCRYFARVAGMPLALATDAAIIAAVAGSGAGPVGVSR